MENRFLGRRASDEHLALQHPLPLPGLYVRGRPLTREAVLRSTLQPSEIDLVHCSGCQLRVDGGEWREPSLADFRRQFAAAKNTVWNVRLFNHWPDDGSRSWTEYDLHFRRAHRGRLNRIDGLSLRTLAIDRISHDAIDRFEADLPDSLPEREYAAALGDYAIGILLKEQRVPPRAPVDFAEFAVKMKGALEVLREFDRPVALAVVGTIRFNLNDFHDYGVSTAPQIAGGLKFFRTLASSGAPPNAAPAADVSTVPVCPVDYITTCRCLPRPTSRPMVLLRTRERYCSPLSTERRSPVHRTSRRVDVPVRATYSPRPVDRSCCTREALPIRPGHEGLRSQAIW